MPKAIAITHWIEWDEAGRRTRLVRALCGALVSRTEHANAPTCEACRLERARLNDLVLE